MIRFEGVGKRYQAGARAALESLSFNVEAGEMVFLTGHSGAGKSSLLKLIALIERPSRGQVVIDGLNTSRVSRRRIPRYRRRLGVVFQDHKLLADRSVFDNVALPLVVAGASPRETGRKVRAALDAVGLLSKERSLPLTLSSGEQQRVGIARAVVARPPLVIADEPTGNLDPALSREIMELFQRFNDVGVTLLIASHDHALVQAMGRRVLTLSEGTLVADVPATERARRIDHAPGDDGGAA